MSVLNLANCATPDSLFNVGKPLCDIAKGKFKGVMFLDQGVSFTPAELSSAASFIAAIKTKSVAARGSRVYPMFDIINFEDNTGDVATGGVGNLSTATIIVNDASPSFRFGYNGSEARHKRLSLMGSQSLDVMFIDDKYAVYGTQSGDNFAGFSVLQAYADVSKFIVADAVNQYSFRLTLGDISQYRENSAYVVTNQGLIAVQGLITTQLTYLSNASNVYKIQPIADGGTNLEPLYGVILAGLTYTIKRLDTGATVTMTSVADDPTLDALTMTIDTTVYAAAPSGTQFQISGPSAAAMSAAGVKPFEMAPVIITKP